MLPRGKSETEFLQSLAVLLTKQECKDIGFEKVKVPKRGRKTLDRIETRFRGLAFDFATAVEEPANFEGCLTSAAMELMRKESIERFGDKFWKAIHLFKLLCHGARVTQHHGDTKGEQFKAIAVQFLAVSWLTEALAVPADGSAVDPAAQALHEAWSKYPVMVGVQFLVQCFLTFDFSKYVVNVTRDAVGWVVPRDASRMLGNCSCVLSARLHAEEHDRQCHSRVVERETLAPGRLHNPVYSGTSFREGGVLELCALS